MATVETTPLRENRFRLSDIDWSSYKAIANAIGERHVRLTYDRGNLEFMTISYEHERWNELLGQFIVVLTEELDMPRQSAGSTTFDREDLARAVEPDRCYYLANAPLMRDKEQIDLTIDPPPDLALEIEISRSLLNRLGIYAAMGVPEVWRFDGDELQVLLLAEAGRYVESDRSRAFPFLLLSEVLRFLRQRSTVDETTLVRSFRQWVREQIARAWQAS